MVTVDEFDKVQKLLHRNFTQRPQLHAFSYTGLIRCAACGCMYTATTKEKRLKRSGRIEQYVYYHCSRKRQKKVQCMNKPLTLEALESQIEFWLEQFHIEQRYLDWVLAVLQDEADEQEAAANEVKNTQEASLRDGKKELDSLIRMRLKELIDDETFIRERNLLNEKITRLHIQLKELNQEHDNRKNNAQKHFEFALHARHQFLNGDAQMRRNIFSGIGSNFQIKDGKLLFEASEWLTLIARQYDLFKAEFERLEPTKNLYPSMYYSHFQVLIPTLLAVIKDVRKVVENNNKESKNIPDLSQIDSTIDITDLPHAA